MSYRAMKYLNDKRIVYRKYQKTYLLKNTIGVGIMLMVRTGIIVYLIVKLK